jgi:hypothetical protein
MHQLQVRRLLAERDGWKRGDHETHQEKSSASHGIDLTCCGECLVSLR